MSAESQPFLALGMVTAPFAFARRTQVRDTMLRYEPVTAGRVAFRFIVGDALHGSSSASKRAAEVPASSRAALTRESTRHGDVAILDALDGAGVEVACSCVEKQSSWMRFALNKWPGARLLRQEPRASRKS